MTDDLIYLTKFWLIKFKSLFKFSLNFFRNWNYWRISSIPNTFVLENLRNSLEYPPPKVQSTKKPPFDGVETLWLHSTSLKMGKFQWWCLRFHFYLIWSSKFLSFKSRYFKVFFVLDSWSKSCWDCRFDLSFWPWMFLTLFIWEKHRVLSLLLCFRFDDYLLILFHQFLNLNYFLYKMRFQLKLQLNFLGQIILR